MAKLPLMEPSPPSGKARKRRPNREAAPQGEQVRLNLSPDSVAFLRAYGERHHLPIRSAVDRLAAEHRRLTRELEKLGMETAGELIVAFRELRRGVQ